MEKNEQIAKVQITEQEIIDVLNERHSEEVQAKLSNARVAVAGLGGLGSNIAVNLARIGIGHMLLVDFDEVELTNLNRQQYFLRHVGKKKTEALAELLGWINPYLDIKTVCVKVTEENISRLFSDYDYICEAFDRADQKAMLVNGVLSELPGRKLVAASGMAGYGNSNQIRTKRVMKNFYLCGDEVSESVPGSGLMAPRVALCAAHQANLVTELILNEGE